MQRCHPTPCPCPETVSSAISTVQTAAVSHQHSTCGIKEENQALIPPSQYLRRGYVNTEICLILPPKELGRCPGPIQWRECHDGLQCSQGVCYWCSVIVKLVGHLARALDKTIIFLLTYKSVATKYKTKHMLYVNPIITEL
ncbi:hypothetical protein WISP_53046 [Willisornis vidua]|uniref:Uncharacterized protein n=1 Tax=Willisornis vidua TaxID=1566151 RepID=A0ABQ9DHF4_9PASS|nr:hypothetical protein WISP_53046 [Willisornis vidua]